MAEQTIYRSPLVDTDLAAYLAYLHSCNVRNGCGEAVILGGNGRGDSGSGTVFNGEVERDGSRSIVGVVDSGVGFGFPCGGYHSGLCLSKSFCHTTCNGVFRHACSGLPVERHASRGVESDNGESGAAGVLRTIRVGVASDDESSFGGNKSFESVTDAKEGDCFVEGIAKSVFNVNEGSECIGVNTLRNREWRKKKKDRKLRKQSVGYVGKAGIPEWRQASSSTGYFSKLSDVDKNRLMLSRAKKLEAENELQQAKAERALSLLRASDIEKEKKMRETRVMRETEVNKVKVEQAFSKLASSGNVPGFAETVVSGVPTLATGSISPNSSISAAEVHAMQKELLELQRRDAKISEQYKKIDPVGFARILKQCEGTVDTSFTADTNGHEIAQYGGYHLGEDNRYHTGETFDYLC